jgi:hypothetical protein
MTSLRERSGSSEGLLRFNCRPSVIFGIPSPFNKLHVNRAGNRPQLSVFSGGYHWGGYEDERSWKCSSGGSREQFHEDVVRSSATRRADNQPTGHKLHTPSRNHRLPSCGMSATTKRVTRSQSKRKVPPSPQTLPRSCVNDISRFQLSHSPLFSKRSLRNATPYNHKLQTVMHMSHCCPRAL